MKKVLNALKALSDETRLRIINLLYERELCVCDIMETLEITQTKASRHLSYLRNTGLVTDRKHAQWVYYSIVKEKDTGFINNLVYDNLRNTEEFRADLEKLDAWLKKKNVNCE